jgi:serine phosphatase RsbU (regulator of sigma subunit)
MEPGTCLAKPGLIEIQRMNFFLNIFKYGSDQHSLAHVKGKLLINFISLTALFSLFYVSVSIFVDYRMGVFVMSANFVLFGLILWLFLRKKITYELAANLYIANCTFVAILLCAYFSGGLFSPVLPWFILIPVIALLLLGTGMNTHGWLWVALGMILIFGILSLNGFDFPMAYNLKLVNFFRITCLSGLTLIIYIVTRVFEHVKEIALEKLSLRNQEMTDSINYANRIQQTLLTPKAEIDQHFSTESFIFFQPKDIVSGDFYWATENGDKSFLAVCDCTGHGVPGAFMSLLIISLLNECINEKGIVEPHHIFNYVRSRLIRHLDGSRDGMDGIILCLDKSDGTFSYASANRNLVVIRKGGVLKFPKDRMHVGRGHSDETLSFNLHRLPVEKGDMIYLYTDGFTDLFGGPKAKKFTSRKLNQQLSEIAHEEVNVQQVLLTEIFHSWKGNLEQVDDVCLVGIKV